MARLRPGVSPFVFATPTIIEKMAKETGGDVLKLASEGKLASALETAMSNLRLQYTLGFTPSHVSDVGSLHRLEVKLNPARPCPGCKVQARSGYYAGSRSYSQGSGTATDGEPYNCGELRAYVENLKTTRIILRAANARREINELNFKAITVKKADAGGPPQVEVHLLIDPKKVAFRNVGGRHRVKLFVTILYADSKGVNLGDDWKTLDLTLDEDLYQEIRKAGIPFTGTVPLKVERQVLKIVVYDPENNLAGSKFIRVK